MESSKLKPNIFDPLRKKILSSTPEEVIRQRLLHYLIEELGYPKHLLLVEKALSELPHLKDIKDLPLRRLDLICLTSSFMPLLLIECKQTQLDQAAAQQVMGYNHYVGAPFVALANEQSLLMIHPQVAPGIPRYETICR